MLLSVAIFLGGAATLTTQILGKDGGYNYRETISVWFRSIFMFQPDVSLMTDVPLQFKLHIVAGLILFAVWPFTRLVHVLSAPVAYPPLCCLSLTFGRNCCFAAGSWMDSGSRRRCRTVEQGLPI